MAVSNHRDNLGKQTGDWAMSKETIADLNMYTMLGNVNDKAKWVNNNWMILQADGSYRAWWQSEGFQNAYDGFIPVDEVDRVLFNWEPIEAPVMLKVPCSADEADGTDGYGNPFRWVGDTKRKAIMNPTNDTVFSYVGVDSYQIHGYHKWLIDGPATIADGELGIDSAGLLRRGGVAYVCMTLPNGVTTARAKLDFKPTLLARTSLDTTASSAYFMTNMIGVCDNSVAAAIHNATDRVKIKHSSRSLTKIGLLRDALGLVYEDAEEFSTWVDGLVDVEVTDRQFKAIVDGLIPIPVPEVEAGPNGQRVKNQRGITIAANKQEALMNMWHIDPRAATWHGTMLGAFQAVNTWTEHMKPQNDNAVDRIMTGTLNGSFAKEADDFWTIVNGIEGIKMPVATHG